MTVRHDKRAAFGDTGDPTQWQASDWNADHLHPPFVIYQICATQAVWVGPSFSGREEILRNTGRMIVDLNEVTDIMLTFYVAEDVFDDPSYVAVEYSIDLGVNWIALASDGIGPKAMWNGGADEVRFSVNSDGFGGTWMPISPLARRTVMIRFVIDGVGGFNDASCFTLWGR